MSTLNNLHQSTDLNNSDFVIPANKTTPFQDKIKRCPKVLIVGGDLGKRTVLELTLQNEGYEVTALENGQQALNYLQQNTPDLMVLDVDTPKVGGIDLCGRVKQVGRLKDVPVIIVSAKKNERIAANANLVGANEFLPRPFKNIELKSKIHNLITKHSYN